MLTIGELSFASLDVHHRCPGLQGSRAPWGSLPRAKTANWADLVLTTNRLHILDNGSFQGLGQNSGEVVLVGLKQLSPEALEYAKSQDKFVLSSQMRNPPQQGLAVHKGPQTNDSKVPETKGLSRQLNQAGTGLSLCL